MALTSEERAIRNRENVKRWKAKNPDKVRGQQKRYYMSHQEKRKAYWKNYYRTMRDKAAKYDELTGGNEK